MRKQPAKKTPVPVPDNDPLRHIRAMGLAYIRFGTALVDPDTDIRELVGLAGACGLKIRFNIGDPPQTGDVTNG